MDVSEIANIENTRLTTKFTLTADEFLEGQRTYFRSLARTSLRLWYRFWIPAGIALLGGGAWGLSLRWNTSFSLFALSFGAILICQRVVLWPMKLKREFRQYRDFGRELVYEFRDEKIFAQAPHSKSELEWTRLTGYAEADKLFVLLAPPRFLYMLPKRGFAPGDVDRFRGLLRQKFPAKRPQDGLRGVAEARPSAWKNLISVGIVVGEIYGMYRFSPWLATSHVVRQRLDRDLRQRLRDSEVRLANARPWAFQGPSGIPPCLVLPLEVGVGPWETPRPGISAGAHQSAVTPHWPDHAIRDCLELIPGGPPQNAAEVNLRSGMPILVQTDLYLPGDPPIAFTRVVEPAYWWKPRYDIYLPNEYLTYPTGHRNPYTDQTLWMADTRGMLFNRISKGTGWADAVYAQTTLGGLFYRAIEGWNGDGWDLDLPDGRTFVFPDSYYARRPQQDALIGLIEPSGASLTMRRDREGNLQEVRSSDGRWMRLNYQGPFVLSIEDSAGEKETYSYDCQKRLGTSTDTSGETLSYSYNTRGQLTAVRNEKSRRTVLTVTYNSGWVASLAVAGGPAYQISYRTDPNDHLTEMDVRADGGGDWAILLRACTFNGCGYEVHSIQWTYPRCSAALSP
jgi:YD repeat-containing protein